MSTFTYVRVACDAAGCQNEVTDSTHGGGLTVTSVTYRAKELGWQVNGRNAHCPTHRTTQVKFHTFVPGSPFSTTWCSYELRKGRYCYKGPDAYIHGGQP